MDGILAAPPIDIQQFGKASLLLERCSTAILASRWDRGVPSIFGLMSGWVMDLWRSSFLTCTDVLETIMLLFFTTLIGTLIR